MGWNDSGNNQDPWNGKNAPPDLDAILRSFLKKVTALFEKGKSKTSSSSPNPSLQIGMILFFSIIFFFWVLSGIFIVDPAEQAVVLRFGKYIKTVGPGPHWIPRFIYSKTVYNVERVSDYSYSAQMLTKDENLVSVSLAVQYRIDDLKDYLFNVTDPEESLKQATSSALRQVVGNTTLDQIITEGREAWGTQVHETLISILKPYQTGILIANVAPQPARAPENVQDAFDDAIKAQEDEKRFKEQAYAYEAGAVPIAEGNAKRIVQEAEAIAKQMVLRAKGEVSEFLAILPVYNRSPNITSERLYLDTIQHVLSRATKVIVDTKANNVLYLPLDRNSITPPPAPLASTLKSALSSPSVPGDQTRPTTRTTDRPTERVE
ncbi:MAG: FtsH protease activity modulator HflK [Gammaproteobacteria bacterium]|nr:FtsH protease activity modulator HflK [Gammaproteobacteria bacterium]